MLRNAPAGWSPRLLCKTHLLRGLVALGFHRSAKTFASVPGCIADALLWMLVQERSGESVACDT